jgi:hypothetical protein
MAQLSQFIINGFNQLLSSRINDTGEAPGCSLRFYAGSRPVNPGFAPTGANLMTVELPHPAVEAFSDGLALLINGIDARVAVSGRATWWRLVNRGGTTIMDGSVGLVNSKSDIELNTIDLVSGNVVKFNRNHSIRYGC